MDTIVATSDQDWIDKIEYYLDHPEEAKQIASAGMQTVHNKHLWSHRVQQLLAIYHTL
jgi:spore maturation protein CgeB